MNGSLGRMTAATEMRFADGSVKLSKTKLEPIRMQVASRSGNKKVHYRWRHSHLPYSSLLYVRELLSAFDISLPAISLLLKEVLTRYSTVARRACFKFSLIFTVMISP